VISTSFSRLLAIVPGIMFGTPEAFEVDKEALGVTRNKRLLGITLGSLLGLGGGVWLITIATAWLREFSLPSLAAVFVAGLESLFLVIFAVAIENLFIQMLAMPGSLGRDLLKYNRWAWGAGLFVITFIFYHTLLNPKGELAQALTATNTRSFFLTIGVFVLGTFLLWMITTLSRRHKAQPVEILSGPGETAKAAEPIVRPESPPVAISPPIQPQIFVQDILHEEPEELTFQADKVEDHPPAEASQPRVTPQVGQEPVLAPVQPLPIEKIEQEPSAVPAEVPAISQAESEPPAAVLQPVAENKPEPQIPAIETAQPAAPSVEEAIDTAQGSAHPPETVEDTKKCPLCAETIKLEARICRYCRTRFEVKVQGYCLNCHALVSLNERDRCSICGGVVVDRHVKSRWLGDQASTRPG
jgi:hypothetical protein